MQNDIFDGNMLLYDLLSYFESESGNRCHRKKERSSYENQRRRSTIEEKSKKTGKK